MNWQYPQAQAATSLAYLWWRLNFFFITSTGNIPRNWFKWLTLFRSYWFVVIVTVALYFTTFSLCFLVCGRCNVFIAAVNAVWCPFLRRVFCLLCFLQMLLFFVIANDKVLIRFCSLWFSFGWQWRLLGSLPGRFVRYMKIKTNITKMKSLRLSFVTGQIERNLLFVFVVHSCLMTLKN